MASFDSVLSELSARAAELQSAVDRWNNWYIAALVAAALIAAAVVYTNRGVIIRQGKLAQTQEAIIRAKDEQLRTELAETNAVRDAESRNKDLKIAEAAGVAAAANERAAKLELDVATQRERAAKAEKSLLELQKNLAPREFTKAEYHALVRSLTRDPKGHVDIVFQTGNPETRLFAGWLAAGLEVSGWTYSLSEVALTLPPAGFGRGVGIAIRDSLRHPARLKTLHDALVSAGIPSAGGLVYLDPSLPEDAVRLSVWPKPVTPRAGW